VSPDLIDELSETLNTVKSEFQGMILAGEKKFFCIGFDLPKLIDLNRAGMSEFFYKVNQTIFGLFTLPIPTACAIRAHAIGAGKTLALACDYRFKMNLTL
jgi:enoyl-CoA hydratase/carnithine racemase